MSALVVNSFITFAILNFCSVSKPDITASPVKVSYAFEADLPVAPIEWPVLADSRLLHRTIS